MIPGEIHSDNWLESWELCDNCHYSDLILWYYYGYYGYGEYNKHYREYNYLIRSYNGLYSLYSNGYNCNDK